MIEEEEHKANYMNQYSKQPKAGIVDKQGNDQNETDFDLTSQDLDISEHLVSGMPEEHTNVMMGKYDMQNRWQGRDGGFINNEPTELDSVYNSTQEMDLSLFSESTLPVPLDHVI